MQDTQNLLYQFNPADFISNFVPLVVILDERVKEFEYKMWNVLIVKEKITVQNRETLQKLIEKISQEYECEDHIYFYSSLLNANETILNAILCSANALFTEGLSTENNLSNLLNNKDSFPVFYLCANKNIEFIKACQDYGIRYHLDFCPDLQNDTSSRLKKVLDRFEKIISS